MKNNRTDTFIVRNPMKNGIHVLRQHALVTTRNRQKDSPAFETWTQTAEGLGELYTF